MYTVSPQSLLHGCHMDTVPHLHQELFGSGGNW